MTNTERPPFRADHVGSLLRPEVLLKARDAFLKGDLDADGLREVEDRSIRDAVRLQEEVGLRGITDGEYRRTYFHIDFLKQLQGVSVEGGIAMKFHSADGEVDFAPPRLTVTGKLAHAAPIQVADFEFLESLTGAWPKVCIPSPTMVHFRGGREAIDAQTYPDLAEFFHDLAVCYQAEIKALADAGCRYVQLDDTNLAYLCDPKLRQGALERGDDPDELPHTYARLINESIAGRPDDMSVCIHLCRGNFKSAWVAEGGYEMVAEALFNEVDVDGFFLEYDDPRSGDFAPLRFVPADKAVVLGLLTSKQGELENKDAVKRRIDEAADYVDAAQLCLSPQCGFSSTVHGNAISFDQQRAKLQHVVDIAQEVWGN